VIASIEDVEDEWDAAENKINATIVKKAE